MISQSLPAPGFWAAPGKFVLSRLDGLLEHSRVDRRIVALALRSVRAAMLIAGWRARLRQRLAATPPPAELAALFPQASRAQVRRWARAIAANDARNKVLCSLARSHGLSSFYPLLRVRDDARLGDLAAAGSPAILLFAHVGAAYGAAAGLGMLGVRTLLLVQDDRVVNFPPTLEGWHVKAREQPLLFLKRAADFLKQGGCVLMALDGAAGGSFVQRDILGRSVRLPRGIQILRGLSRVPVIPVSALWGRGGRIDFATYPPIVGAGGPADAEPDELVRAVRWMEALILRDPRQLRSPHLGQFVEASHANAARGAAAPQNPTQSLLQN